jgi:hypothetical protein
MRDFFTLRSLVGAAIADAYKKSAAFSERKKLAAPE